ncbi:MAG: helix-turn-helix transcriptional regulator [Candidatus Dormibacteraceae bacterium]
MPSPRSSALPVCRRRSPAWCLYPDTLCRVFAVRCRGIRGDRLLSILLQLQSAGRLTAGALADRLEVSERTILRDLDALSTAGIPVFTERGRNGGIRLVDGFRTDLTGLTSGEARALFSFGGPPVAGELGLGTTLDAALHKLLAAMPPSQREGAQRARERLLVDATPWLREPEAVPHLATIEDAVWGQTRVRLRYRRAGGRKVERTVEPLGLVVKAGVWYLLAAAGGAIRTYRLSRVEAAERTEERFERPAGFDLARHWAEVRSSFRRRAEGVFVAVRVTPEQVVLFTRLVAGALVEPMEALPPGEDGWPRYALRYPALGAARGSLLALGPWIEVLAPRELRQSLRAAAEAVVALYEAVAGPQGSARTATGRLQ